MLLYLDNSFLNRPFDDPEVGTNKLEGEILALIIKQAKQTKIDVINSSVIEYENSLNPIPERKIFVKGILKQTKIYQNVDENIRKQAENLADKTGISPIDALHLTSAEAANADVFITCDYDIIKKYRGKVKVVTPLEFINLYEHTNN